MQTKIKEDNMTVIQEQAIEIIKNMPDEKIYYVINILKGIDGLYPANKVYGIEKSQAAYENLQHFRKPGITDRNYKAELANAWEEKYESVD
ncbi:MAG: hypothetical protein HFH67_11100 [Lachnospiraceae bacterium]|nr:hypothetical protein [Lachnospiraceae bacterium]